MSIPLAYGQPSTQQETANSVKGKRGTLLNLYDSRTVDEGTATGLTGSDSSVSGSRSASSGTIASTTDKTTKILCSRGLKNFGNTDGTYYRVSGCVPGSNLTVSICTPNRSPNDPDCPKVIFPGAPVTVSYTNNTLQTSITTCANPAIDKCDFRVRSRGNVTGNWQRDTIEAQGAEAAARPEARGNKAANSAVTSAEVFGAYSGINRPQQYARLGTIEAGATSGRLVTGGGTDIGAFNQNGRCVKQCMSTIGDGTIAKQCTKPINTTSTSCETQYPRLHRNYNIGRVDTSCVAIHPATCAATAGRPPGYGPWVQYRQTPPAAGRVNGTSYTTFFASFQTYTAGNPPSGLTLSSTVPMGPPITNQALCSFTGQSCTQFDPNVTSQCRVYQVRLRCPADRETRCSGETFADGFPKPPANLPNTAQFANPGPQTFTKGSGQTCRLGDNSSDPEAIEDGSPVCSQTEDGQCIRVPGGLTCQGEGEATTPCTGSAYAGCTQGATTCSETGSLGICTQTTTEYQCPTVNSQCQQYETVCSVNGVEYSREQDSAGSGWTNAVGAMSLVEQITSEAKDTCAREGTCDLTSIKVFNGKAESCKRQLGSGVSDTFCSFSPPDYAGTGPLLSPCPFGALRTNCCDINVNKEQDSLIGGKCGSGDVDLAAARRQNRAFQLANRCTSRLFGGPCLERTQIWCHWPSVLAKEINIQGREQLKAMFATTSTSVTQNLNMNWNFFSPSESGSWSAMISAGPNRTRAWQWPSYCASPNDPRQSSSNCGTGNESIVMTCSTGKCDAALPTHPTKSTVDAPDWYSVGVPKMSGAPESIALGRSGFMRGSCNGVSCFYSMNFASGAHTQAGVGLMELEWPYTDPQTAIGERVMNGSYAMIAFPKAPGSPLTSTVRIGISAAPNLANPDATVYLYFDVSTTGGTTVANVSGKPLQVVGTCDRRSNFCNYRFHVPINVTPKRWNLDGLTDTVRDIDEADCTGFTVDEFALLDTSKMNLESVIASMTGGDKGAPLASASLATGDFAATSQATFVKKENEYSTGLTQSRNTAGISSEVVTLTPAVGVAPWTTTLTYPSLYPASSVENYNTDPSTRRGTRVHSVTIDWGDGNVENHVPSSPDGVNAVTHTYADGAGKREADYKVVTTFRLDSKTDGAALGDPASFLGTTESCGVGCLRLTLGVVGTRYYIDKGGCWGTTEAAQIRVSRPDKIESVRLVEVGLDDWIRAKVNGAIVWNEDPAWTYPTPRCGENNSRGTRYPNVDVTSAFTSATPGSNVELRFDLSTADDGHGWTKWEIRLKEPCLLASDGCEGGVGGTGLVRTVTSQAASRYDGSDLSRKSGGAQDSVSEFDTRPDPALNVPGAR